MAAHVVCFGELLLRMTAPGRELLMQSGRMDIHVGGAEANVAVALACLGHATTMVSAVPDNALGRGATSALRARGVDCSAVRVREGRMGLYFLSPGAGLRPSDILYDRTATAFANITADAFDWDVLLDGAQYLHMSGITPALGPAIAELAIGAAERARMLGVPVSFDCNHRARLWQAWDSDPVSIMTRLIRSADIVFGNQRDFTMLLGRDLSGDGDHRRREGAEAMFAAFPNIGMIASTARYVDDADRHRIAARGDTPTQAFQSEEINVAGIVDRIGSGDAFAAGVLHGVVLGQSLEATVRSGLALACLKHSLPGDFSLFGQADLDAFMTGDLDVRR